MNAKTIGMVVLGLIGAVILSGLAHNAIDSLREKPLPAPTPDSVRQEMQKQKDIGDAEKVDEAAAKADRLAVLGVVGKTYDAMRDQQSISVSSVGVIHTPKAVTACLEYGAKNGFGGMNRGLATWQLRQGGVFKFTIDSPSVWNKECAHKDYVDYTDIGRLLLKKMKDLGSQ
jgi:hypothetical protein